jgi:hypothetical protein
MMASLVTACEAPDDDATSESEALASAEQPMAAETTLNANPPSKKQARKWMRWALEQPWSTGPVTDPSGASCGQDQEGPLFFLAGTIGGSVTRQCTIPAGKKLFFPLVNYWCGYPEEFYPTADSIEEAVPANLAWFETVREHACTLTLRVDGEDVFTGGFDDMVDELHVQLPELFTIDLPEGDNLYTPYGVAGGPAEFHGGGFYARLKPLSPGDHVLELGGSLCDGDTLWFETTATYHLHVEE